jgi:hypothetical protein
MMPLRARSRSATRAGRQARGRPRMIECPWGAKFEYRLNGAAAALGCPKCADLFTVYDRDRGIGAIPANLAKKYGDAA